MSLRLGYIHSPIKVEKSSRIFTSQGRASYKQCFSWRELSDLQMSESSQKFALKSRVLNPTLPYSDSVVRSGIWKSVFFNKHLPLVTIKYSEVGQALVQSMFAFERVCCHNFRIPADSCSRNRKSQTVEDLGQSLRFKVSKSLLY